MTPTEHAQQAYKAYRSKIGMNWHEDETDAEKFIEAVVGSINVALCEASAPEVQQSIMKDTANGAMNGKVELSVGAQGDEVAVDFGCLIRHVSFPPDAAIILARLITKVAKKLKRK